MGRNHRVSLKLQHLTKDEDHEIFRRNILAGRVNEPVRSTNKKKDDCPRGHRELEEGEGGREKNLWQGVYRTHAASSSS